MDHSLMVYSQNPFVARRARFRATLVRGRGSRDDLKVLNQINALARAAVRELRGELVEEEARHSRE
jgi:hypothetical protein